MYWVVKSKQGLLSGKTGLKNNGRAMTDLRW